MRKTSTILCFMIILSTRLALAQIGINNAEPDTNAILDIKHDTKGILIPRIDDISKVDKVNASLFFNNVDNKFYYYCETTNTFQCINPFNSKSPDEATLEGNLNLNNLKVEGLVETDLRLEATKIQITRSGVVRDIIRRKTSESDDIYIGNVNDNLYLQTKSGGNLSHMKGSMSHIIWDESNDGSGSGLNADLLDGQDKSYYENADNLNTGILSDDRLSSNILKKDKDLEGAAHVVTTFVNRRIGAGESWYPDHNLSIKHIYLSGLIVHTQGKVAHGQWYIKRPTQRTDHIVFIDYDHTNRVQLVIPATGSLYIMSNTDYAYLSLTVHYYY